MADVFSNIQNPVNNPAAPVIQPVSGEFMKSDVKVIAEMQQRFHARVESLGILEEVAALEKNPVRNFAWKVFATLGFFRFWPEEASNLSDVVARMRKGVEEVDPNLVKDEQKNPATNIVPLQTKPVENSELKKAA